MNDINSGEKKFYFFFFLSYLMVIYPDTLAFNFKHKFEYYLYASQIAA